MLFENLIYHEFLFAIVLPMVLIAIYYFYLDIDYKFLFVLSTYYYVIIPIIIVPHSNETLQIINHRQIIQQCSMFLVFSTCCSEA